MLNGVWTAAAVVAGCVAGVAAGDVTYESQSRSLSVNAVGDELHETSAGLGVFNSELHVFHQHEHGQYSSGDGFLASSLEAGSMTLADRILATDAFGEGGSGGGGGSAVLDVTFRVVGTQRFDFVATWTMDASGQWYWPSVQGTLTGPGGTVFALQGFIFNSTERHGGELGAGLYHLHLEHDFGYGGSGTGGGVGTFAANLTVPSPGAGVVLVAGLVGLRRRR